MIANKRRYQLPVLPRRMYANFYLKERDNARFINENYLRLLRFIGKHCYNEENLRVICRKLKEEYNATYHFNRLRHAKRRMSTNQIEALAFSFDRILRDNDVIVRIPVATIPILFFILMKYQTKVECNEDISREINETTIGAYLCAQQISIMKIQLDKMLTFEDDETYVRHCRSLYDELVMHPRLIAMNWDELNQNRVDYVEAYWEKR